ncbi:synapse-associated protein of 47 kDa isoform X3 [Phymastichus coffea]|uniref:synapse-associated protein of 47 kDa isoform X3 n=1 Tax=Phymastichus coffea TaxID=108790 RepID=UPI00273A9135|nr:synapse-associated protein of 47 kDa isoform X3 [Phymastichus coffea]
MFSGLTNQVSNWMGKKAEDGAEGAPLSTEAPVQDAVEADVAAGSPTKGGSSKLEMLAGVKSQVASSMSGWLSGGIPGLNRGGASAEVDQNADPLAVAESTRDPAVADTTENVKDDDASSATGGADSGPGSLGGTPTDDKDAQQAFGADSTGQRGAIKAAVSTKALAGAKSLGGFLYSAVNKAGKSVAEAGAKIKKTVEENRLIAELNKEQEAFIAGKGGEKGEAVPPWVGAPDEDALREECLALSTDRRNFVRSPPPGVDFAWDFEAIQPIAQATLAVDSNLESMRFELVPKVISEENFWRNYFYRVSLLRQSHELNALASQQSTESNPSQVASSHSIDNAQVGAAETLATAAKPTTHENVEQTNEALDKLTVQPSKEEDWERELDAELKDYEVVPDRQASSKTVKSSDDWLEGQIDELLNDDEDLK